MNKFNEVAQTVLGEAEANLETDNYYRQISDLLSKKGLRAYQYEDVMEVVQKAVVSASIKGREEGRKEGKMFAETNPFK